MALVAFSRNRIASQEELHPFERLAASLSSSFSTFAADEVETAVAQAVEDIGMAFGVDECTLLSFLEPGTPTVLHSWAVPPHVPCRDEDLPHMPWLVQRLARNAVVALTPEMDLPHAASDDRAYAQRSGIVVRLGVPIAVGNRVTYGLLVAARQRQADWRTPLVDRLRLVGEIVGSGLERRRLEDTRESREAERETIDRTSGDLLYLQEEARNKVEADQIVGESSGFRAALTRLSQVAPLDATVLLLGETGTGKELFARALHDRSRRRARMLVRVNCAALPASLIESELFGHERGAFTGAISTRQGRFELADGGTIFLDEIGDLAPELQAKLLRVLQEGEFERVGSSKVRKVDVRVIAATHINLEEAVAAGRFRADLYYRLSVFPIQLPALRERRDDIPQLVWFFIHRRQRELGRRIVRIPAPVMQALQRHDWPGNVRELENVVERAMIRSADGTLQLDDAPRADRAAERLPDGVESLDAVQRYHIERVLRECGGRINGVGNAAARLGIHPNTLRFRIAKLGVVMPERKPLHANRPGAGRLE
jgi:transcriptional regulator with GAF, ATPase, and Fis domain